MVVSTTHRPSLIRRRFSWSSVLLQAESIPGPRCGREDQINEKSE